MCGCVYVRVCINIHFARTQLFATYMRYTVSLIGVLFRCMCLYMCVCLCVCVCTRAQCVFARVHLYTNKNTYIYYVCKFLLKSQNQPAVSASRKYVKNLHTCLKARIC